MLNLGSPRSLMIAGFALQLAGWLVILFMVIGLLSPSLLLSLGAYAASVSGLIVGLLGAGLYVVRGRR